MKAIDFFLRRQGRIAFWLTTISQLAIIAAAIKYLLS